jgi:hypothetical protein
MLFEYFYLIVQKLLVTPQEAQAPQCGIVAEQTAKCLAPSIESDQEATLKQAALRTIIRWA